MAADRRVKFFRLIALAAVLVASVAIYLVRDQAVALAKYGYPGIFILSILANATVILPAPGILFVFTMGAVFDPLYIALAAGAGAAIGELFGYLIGYSGRGIVEKADAYHGILNWMERHRRWSYALIFVLAFVPNPLFDLAGVAAGTLKIPIGGFLICTFLGKTLKMLLIAFAGAYSLERILD